ncbi:hypothetical protein AGR4A_Cc140003 [Agrobacterium tumefaciens str. B6]|uniref:Uncharacterized protein n=1 Tax=Agrobacterium tumefaciens str. B6 TaxID=1183423 RepID=A0A822UX85_AGRTU|nr:hypothetical protein AGR4A_Cc140003 [Agrobacterium tumefaciens str. B6]
MRGYGKIPSPLCGYDRPAVMLHSVQPLNAAGNYHVE